MHFSSVTFLILPPERQGNRICISLPLTGGGWPSEARPGGGHCPLQASPHPPAFRKLRRATSPFQGQV
jgi:hypothetical protein